MTRKAAAAYPVGRHFIHLVSVVDILVDRDGAAMMRKFLRVRPWPERVEQHQQRTTREKIRKVESSGAHGGDGAAHGGRSVDEGGTHRFLPLLVICTWVRPAVANVTEDHAPGAQSHGAGGNHARSGRHVGRAATRARADEVARCRASLLLCRSLLTGYTTRSRGAPGQTSFWSHRKFGQTLRVGRWKLSRTSCWLWCSQRPPRTRLVPPNRTSAPPPRTPTRKPRVQWHHKVLTNARAPSKDATAQNEASRAPAR